MKLENIMLNEISLTKKGQILGDSTYMKYLEEAAQQKQKTEQK